MSRGRANQSVAGVVWRRMLSTTDSDSLPRGAMPFPVQAQREGDKVSPGWWEDSRQGDALGFVWVWHHSREWLWFAPSMGKSLLQESS